MSDQRKRLLEIPLTVFTIFLRAILVIHAYAIFNLILLEVAGPLVAAVTSAAGGALLIWATARWINVRSDPRHAKHPPDAP